jgi:hypothetical protein
VELLGTDMATRDKERKYGEETGEVMSKTGHGAIEKARDKARDKARFFCESTIGSSSHEGRRRSSTTQCGLSIGTYLGLKNIASRPQCLDPMRSRGSWPGCSCFHGCAIRLAARHTVDLDALAGIAMKLDDPLEDAARIRFLV